MVDRRIQFDKTKAEIIEELCSGEEHRKVFATQADCLSFAAAYGFHHKKRVQLCSPSSSSIRFSIFENSNHDTLVYLLAMKEEKDAHVLADDDVHIEKRAKIFEEYANGGLELLKRELAGTLESIDHFLLLINNELAPQNDNNDVPSGFNLSDLEI